MGLRLWIAPILVAAAMLMLAVGTTPAPPPGSYQPLSAGPSNGGSAISPSTPAPTGGTTGSLSTADNPIPPGDIVVLAAQDAARLDPVLARRARYLSLAHVPAAERKTFRQVLGGLVNSLSREPGIVPPVAVGDYLLRLDVTDYGRYFAQAWEELDNPDPFFHVQLEQEVVVNEVRKQAYGYKDRYGKWTITEYRDETVEVKKVVRQAATAPWLSDTPEHQTYLKLLLDLTQSRAPIVAGDWFLYQVGIQAGRSPGYYDFLGIKDEATFDEAVGFSARGVDPGFLRGLRERISISTVTQQPRALFRFGTPGGAKWLSEDVVKPVDRSNPLRVLTDDLLFAGTEQLGHLPNGFLAMGVFTGNDNPKVKPGTRLDSVPDTIASDRTAPHNDRRVHAGLCIRCHDSGLNEITAWVREGVNKLPNYLAVADPDQARVFRQQYAEELTSYLVADNRRYAVAVAKATGGMVPREYSSAFASMWKRYAEDPVTVERAARDAGVPVEELVAALVRQGAAVDPVTSAFRQPVPATISPEAYFEVVPLLQQALSGGGYGR